MPVKHWSFAGLILTNWCNAECASCYLACGSARDDHMSADMALRLWRELGEASPQGCRIHLTGGEPFGDYPRLIDICRRAKADGLLERAPLEKVETNAFWADSPAIVRDRVRELSDAGMGKLCISADPYHQQFVPIDRCRLAAEVAEQVLGGDRVQVRWRDWLSDGCDTDAMSAHQRGELFARYAAVGRDRINGRAAAALAPLLKGDSAGQLQWSPPGAFADKDCSLGLLRSKHVHIDPAGRVIPGTCAGIMLGRACDESVGSLWWRLSEDSRRRPVVGTLARGGPAALLDEAVSLGFEAAQAYLSKCHLCQDVRNWLTDAGRHGDELYRVQVCSAEGRTLAGK